MFIYLYVFILQYKQQYLYSVSLYKLTLEMLVNMGEQSSAWDSWVEEQCPMCRNTWKNGIHLWTLGITMAGNWQVWITQDTFELPSYPSGRELRFRGIMRQYSTPFGGSMDLFFWFKPSSNYCGTLKTGLYVIYIYISLMQQSRSPFEPTSCLKYFPLLCWRKKCKNRCRVIIFPLKPPSFLELAEADCVSFVVFNQLLICVMSLTFPNPHFKST